MLDNTTVKAGTNSLYLPPAAPSTIATAGCQLVDGVVPMDIDNQSVANISSLLPGVISSANIYAHWGTGRTVAPGHEVASSHCQ